MSIKKCGPERILGDTDEKVVRLYRTDDFNHHLDVLEKDGYLS